MIIPYMITVPNKFINIVIGHKVLIDGCVCTKVDIGTYEIDGYDRIINPYDEVEQIVYFQEDVE